MCDSRHRLSGRAQLAGCRRHPIPELGTAVSHQDQNDFSHMELQLYNQNLAKLRSADSRWRLSPQGSSSLQ